MRILFLNTGSGAHFRGVAGYLARHGHKIYLPAADRPRFEQAAGSISFWRPWQARGLDVVYLRIDGRPVRLPGRFPQLLFGLLRRLFGWIVVWEINAAPELIAYDGTELDRARLAQLERGLRRQARGVEVAICNTEGLCRFAHELGIARAVHVPLATTPALFTPSAHDSPRLEVCWLTGTSAVAWHDTDTVLAAAGQLRANPDVHFHVVGDCAPQPDSPNLTRHGRLEPAPLAALLQQMDVGIAVYRRDHWSRYGLFASPLKVFDYMAAGLLVVASPIEQVRSLIEQGAFVRATPFEDAAALAELLSGIQKDEAFLHGCQENVRQALDYYHWDRVGAVIEDLIR
jgi:glycosyltransferase involved in cell wall biosynthesis